MGVANPPSCAAPRGTFIRLSTMVSKRPSSRGVALRTVAVSLGAGVLLGACAEGGGGDRGVRVEPVASPAPAGARWPNLAADSAGRVYLTWVEPGSVAAGDTVWRVRFATLDAGASDWSAPRTVAEGRDLLVNWADFPSVVPLGGGRIAAQWPVRDPRGRFAYAPRVAQSADGGATWTPAVAPQRSDAAAEYDFAVLFPAGASGDSLGVAWLDGRAGAGGHGKGVGGERFSLYFTTQAASGALGAEAVADTLTCSCCRNAVARTSRGVVVTYRNRTADEIRDIHLRRYEGGQWSAPTPVHRDGWRIEGCPTEGAAVAARGDTIRVAWFTGARDTARVQVAFSPDGGRTFGAPVRVDDGGGTGRVGVAATPGGALVSWLERTDGGAELRLRHVRADGARGAHVVVATSAGGRAAGVPQLTAAGEAAYVAWTQPASGGAPAAVRVARVAIPGAVAGVSPRAGTRLALRP
jgi:hypothetical protein